MPAWNSVRVPALVAFLALVAGPAVAWVDPEPTPVAFSRFAKEGRVNGDGHVVEVSGRANCTLPDGVVQVAVSVLQQETLASVRGYSAQQPCGENNEFSARLVVPADAAAFADGPVQACALAQVRAGETTVDYDMWCVFVTLVRDPNL